jgi:rubrerythrin
MQAVYNYRAYAQRAIAEKYPNIAKLFATLAASETVHARNSKACLAELDGETQNIPQPQVVTVADTRKNLKFATAVELEEIDKKYPEFMEQIRPENHVPAIQFISYAWESEKQHRELLNKIKSGTDLFFGLLTKRIEGNPYQYFVCQNCGSTLSGIPASAYPICGGPSAAYKEIIR